MFQATYIIGDPFEELIEKGFTMLAQFVAGFIPNYYLASFICDGIIGGVGGVISFLPIIVIIFLCLSILEDCGYLARAAFTMDIFMHKLVGLHGGIHSDDFRIRLWCSGYYGNKGFGK